MKYLKLFENMTELYRQVGYSEYYNYRLSHDPETDEGNIRIISNMFNESLEMNIRNSRFEDSSYIVPLLLLSVKNVYYSPVYRYDPKYKVPIKTIYIYFFHDEYVTIDLGISDKDEGIYFICDGRDGVESFLKNLDF
jgi:hypothetical protein